MSDDDYVEVARDIIAAVGPKTPIGELTDYLAATLRSERIAGRREGLVQARAQCGVRAENRRKQAESLAGPGSPGRAYACDLVVAKGSEAAACADDIQRIDPESW